MADASWDSAALAHAVCDKLVERGVLKEKPAFIRTDREAKIAKVFEVAKLDGESGGRKGGRGRGNGEGV